MLNMNASDRCVKLQGLWHDKGGHTCDPKPVKKGGALNRKSRARVCGGCQARCHQFCQRIASHCRSLRGLEPLASWLSVTEASTPEAKTGATFLEDTLTQSLMRNGGDKMKRIARSALDAAIAKFVASPNGTDSCASGRTLLNGRLHPGLDTVFMGHYDAATAPRFDSHKVLAARNFIAKMRAKVSDQPTLPSKAVIFSKAPNTLMVLANELQPATFRLICGDKTAAERAAALTAFRSNSDVDVLLLSVETGALGVTLVVADHLLLLEPCENASREAQLINRVHRIGQTRPVHIVKLCTKGTIEERILNLRALSGRGMTVTDGDENLAVPSIGAGVADDNNGLRGYQMSTSVRGSDDLRFLLGVSTGP